MSEVRLLVREAECDWIGTVHASWADRAIAALVTLEELEAAFARFVKPSASGRSLGNLSCGFCDEPYDAGVVVVDLAARLNRHIPLPARTDPSPTTMADVPRMWSCPIIWPRIG